jgi:ATP synthase protein I
LELMQMSERKTEDIDDIAARLDGIKKTRATSEIADKRRTKGLGLAMRMGMDLVAACFVGGFLGHLMDQALGTRPWFMLGMFIVGVAAGMRNMVRSAYEAQEAVSKEQASKEG